VRVPPESLEVGRCYLANDGRSPRIRRVVQFLPGGRVQYEQRGPKTARRMRMTYREHFAVMVWREVPCDWIPERDETVR
jgi:hypothetical protein